MIILPRRPLVGLAIIFMTGTALGLVFPVHPVVAFCVAAACLIPAFMGNYLSPGKPYWGSVLAHIGIFGAMFGLAWGHASPPPGDSAPAPSTLLSLPSGVAMTGVVRDEPVCISCRNGKAIWKFPVSLEQIKGRGLSEWQATSGTVRVRLYATPTDPTPAYGERWTFWGYMSQMTYKKGRFIGQTGPPFFSGSASKALLLETGAGNPLIQSCLRGRVWAERLLAQGIRDRPEQNRILNSILLGYYSQIPRDLYRAFANTGTLHVFAISGSHVMIFAAAVIFLLAACGLPRTRWILFLGPLLVLYTAMTGMQPSAVRACIMAIIYWIAPMIGRKPDIYTTLALSAILILAVQPDDLTNIGFILSYVAVLGLVLLCPVFLTPLHRCFRHDDFKLEPDPPWQNLLRSGWILFSDLLAVSLAAWLVTAPLTAWFFGNFSPIGLLANLLIVPLSSLVIITGVLALTLGSCFLFLADLFNHANLALITLMTESARYFARIPGGCLEVPAPPLWAILLFYTLLLTTRFAWWVYGGGERISMRVVDEE